MNKLKHFISNFLDALISIGMDFLIILVMLVPAEILLVFYYLEIISFNIIGLIIAIIIQIAWIMAVIRTT